MISNPQNTEAVENFCTVLEKRIDAHRKEIARLDWAAAAFDADRLWPLDMDLTVLSMQRFRLRHGRLPDSWAELRKSSVLSEQVNALRSIEPVADYWQRLENAGVISDNSCVHQNWELKRTDDAWEIIVPGWRKIGYGN